MSDNPNPLIAGHFEPELIAIHLPGCRECGDKHPLAYKPQRPAAVCPGCGAPAAAPGEAVVSRGIVSGTGGVPVIIARACLAIGRGLSKLAKRI